MCVFKKKTIYKRDAINLADPSDIQDMCYMNFIIDLAYGKVSGTQW